MKIIVTGALGHIGSRLIRSLDPAVREAVLVDDLSTHRYASLFHLPAGVRFQFLQADVRNAPWADLLPGAAAVVHLAAITDAESSFSRKDKVHEVNCGAAVLVARECLKHSTPMIFVSTTSVYGVSHGTVDESCLDLKPQSSYAEAKLEAENRLSAMKAEGLSHVTLRFGTIFGPSPGMRFHTAVNKFVWQASLGIPVTVWKTSLDQKRPYLDLTDAVAALKFVIQNRVFDGDIYNVVTANATVNDVLTIIRRHRPSLRISLTDSPVMNQLSYEVSADRFRRLGFQFRGALESGIAESMEYLGSVQGI
ncbi:SDR family oxidoreductase [bacterium]|nr:SDR family oxidoreductase [bacterium]